MKKICAKQDMMKRRLKELESVESELQSNKLVGQTLSPPAVTGGLRVRPTGLIMATCFVLFFILIFCSDSLHAQKKTKRSHIKKADAATADTLNAIIARHQWQFPIRTFLDDALKESQKSHRPVLAFNVDYVDPNSIYVRDKLLQDPEVMIYLTKNFELALHDYSVDPPPEVGFDSLRTLGHRLDQLEKGYSIVSRPTAIIIHPDSTEIERIPDLQNYSGKKFIQIINEYLSDKNTIHSLGREFWSDPKNLDKHKRYLDRLMERFDYDSIVYHYDLLAHDPGFGQTPAMMKDAAAEYAYIRFKQEGNVTVLKKWLFSLDRHSDSSIMLAGLKDILEYYQSRKKIDSISVYYQYIFAFAGEREPDLLNNYAWDLANFSSMYDSAYTLINQAILKESKNPNFYDTRALIDYDRKEYDTALSDAKLALKYSGKDDAAYFKERLEFFEKEKKRISDENKK
jgi:hypothetical protein